MKKLHAAIAVAAALSTSAAFAEEKSEDLYKWVGGYAMHYDVNLDKPQLPTGYLKDGIGFGLEAGWKFTDSWALRAEITHLFMDSEQRFGQSYDDEEGNLFGLDAMYFLEDDVAYLFSGLKMLDLDQRTSLLNAGVGKHWKLNEKATLITEVAGYYDFGEGTKDWSLKLGFAWNFGDAGKAATKAAPAAPADADNDGVVDANDRCPSTPAGTKVDANGCPMPMDSDKDGVADNKDKCANTPKGDVVDREGCSKFGEKEVSKTLRVLFANNSDVVENPSDADIADLADFMKRYGKVDAVIEGHASAPGNADYNMDLSKRRAESFKQVLVDQYGIKASRLSTEGYGETRLLDSSNTAEANRVNRRIVVNISETVKVKMSK